MQSVEPLGDGSPSNLKMLITLLPFNPLTVQIIPQFLGSRVVFASGGIMSYLQAFSAPWLPFGNR